MLVLDTKEIAHPDVVKTVLSAKKVCQDQFDTFTNECLVDRTKPVDDTSHRNKLCLFSTSTKHLKKRSRLTL